MNGCPDQLFNYKFPAEVTVHHYRLLDTEAAWKTIQEIASECAPDCVLIVNSGQPSLILAAALYDLPFPVVYSERGAPDYTLEHSWCSQTQRELTHFAADMSHVLMPDYIKSAPPFLHDWVRIIPSVTERGTGQAAVKSPNADGRYSVIYTGRFSFEKDLHLLIEAFARIAADFPQWDVTLIGDGPDREQLEMLARELNLESRVNFKGAVEDLNAVFAAYLQANLFVLTSRAEACPLSLREAMAHGLPVIGFASCSGTNEIIRDGINGLLADGTAKVENLATAMASLMDNPELRETMGRAGAQDIEQYAPDTIHNSWEQLLLDAAQWKGRRDELRLRKRLQANGKSDYLADTLDEVRGQRTSRNIVAYHGNVRSGTASQRLLSDYLLLFGSCLFDRQYYYANYLDVRLSGIDPLEHYLLDGWKNGYRPSEGFDCDKYVETSMGGQANDCPLIHFYRAGSGSHRDPLSVLSPAIADKLKSEKFEDHEDWPDAQELSSQKVAKALSTRIHWERFTKSEILAMKAE